MQENESKAAPVGEREAFETWFNKEKLPSVSYGNPNILKKPLWPAFQAGAAYQRTQQPQDAWEPSYSDYDRSIHANPDAKAWADFFVATFPGLADKHELMISWFANAMMAMHDYLKAQQPQSAEAVSAQVRFRRPEKGMPDWSVWQQTSIKPHMPAWSIDSAGYEVEYRLLYTTPQPSAGVVMQRDQKALRERIEQLEAENAKLRAELKRTATWIEELPVPTVGAAGS